MKKLAILSILSVFFVNLSAQEGITDFLEAGESALTDIEKLSEAYMEPLGVMFGKGLNAGWYNTAKPHKMGGFDITITASVVRAPSSVKMYNIDELGLTTISGTGEAPTVAGEEMTTRPDLSVGAISIGPAPNGASLNMVPMPMIKAGVGLPYHTELNVRFLPKLSVQDASFNLWGVGFKHDLKDYIPFFKRIPVLQLSAFVGYTKFTSSYGIEYNLSTTNFDNQELEFSSSGFTGRIIAGVNLPVLAIYTGIGFGSVKTDMNLVGTYPLGTELAYTEEIDPVSLNFSDGGLDFNAGLRIKLAVVTFHFDYTLSNYQLLSAGVGFSFR